MVVLASWFSCWRQALLIVKPDTLIRWHRQGFRLFWKIKSSRKSSKPKIAEETVALIKQMAAENRLWGAERIQGELLKLGIKVAKRTVQKYMRKTRKPTLPGQNWAIFLRNHSKDIWACDFLPVVDLFFGQIYAFFVVELGSRRVVHFSVTRHPTDEWTAQQLREATAFGAGPKYLIRDNDAKFGTKFQKVAEGASIKVLKTPIAAPKANSICERFLGSVRREALDHLLILNERQLGRILKEYVEYFNKSRPHQGIGQAVPDSQQNSSRLEGKIVSFPVMGGLHHL
jgi:putative transposase